MWRLTSATALPEKYLVVEIQACVDNSAHSLVASCCVHWPCMSKLHCFSGCSVPRDMCAYVDPQQLLHPA